MKERQELMNKAVKLLETYYLEDLIEVSDLTQEEVLVILMESGEFSLPEVLPLD